MPLGGRAGLLAHLVYVVLLAGIGQQLLDGQAAYPDSSPQPRRFENATLFHPANVADANSQGLGCLAARIDELWCFKSWQDGLLRKRAKERPAPVDTHRRTSAWFRLLVEVRQWLAGDQFFSNSLWRGDAQLLLELYCGTCGQASRSVNAIAPASPLFTNRRG
jgi:hypothetical protein